MGTNVGFDKNDSVGVDILDIEEFISAFYSGNSFVSEKLVKREGRILNNTGSCTLKASTRENVLELSRRDQKNGTSSWNLLEAYLDLCLSHVQLHGAKNRG